MTAIRTGADLRAAREALGQTTASLAKALRARCSRTVRHWENGDRRVPGPVCALVEMWLDPHCPPEFLPERVFDAVGE
jgi:DNA-binding transcriptional regulator YiaG